MCRKHELISVLHLDIHRISQQKLLTTVAATPGKNSTTFLYLAFQKTSFQIF